MKKLIVILDPAHGANIAGKCSPDGTHREYRWSRERVKGVLSKLKMANFEVYQTTLSENEPGLSYRKNFATRICPGQPKLFLSLHNNASGDSTKWGDAKGTALYTTKGITKADKCADIIFQRFSKDFPDINMRKYSCEKLGKDFEENFTVLMGRDYMGVLIEWLFQDNRQDVEKLADAEMNERFELSLVKAIEEINERIESL